MKPRLKVRLKRNGGTLLSACPAVASAWRRSDRKNCQKLPAWPPGRARYPPFPAFRVCPPELRTFAARAKATERWGNVEKGRGDEREGCGARGRRVSAYVYTYCAVQRHRANAIPLPDTHGRRDLVFEIFESSQNQDAYARERNSARTRSSNVSSKKPLCVCLSRSIERKKEKNVTRGERFSMFQKPVEECVRSPREIIPRTHETGIHSFRF